jgi:putative DNA primase/helicase
VACGVVDLQWLKENRDQLFAEAVVRYQKGESWWDVPADEHRQKIDARRQEDTWTGSVLTYMEDHAPCSMDAVLRSGVGKQTETQTSGDQRRCAAILKLHGYENFFDNSDGKRRKWRKKGTR